MTRAVLFDAAGTLMEPTIPVGERYRAAALAQGVDLGAWRIEDAFRRVLRRKAPMCFPEAGDDEIVDLERAWWRDIVRQTFQATDSTVIFPDLDGLFGRLWDEFADPASWQLRAGAAEALEALDAAGLATGVVSNFDHRLPKILQGLGIQGRMKCVVLPGDHRVAKPDPRVFAPALAALGLPAEEVVYVGDDDAVDGEAARAAGLDFVDASQLESLASLPALLG